MSSVLRGEVHGGCSSGDSRGGRLRLPPAHSREPLLAEEEGRAGSERTCAFPAPDSGWAGAPRNALERTCTARTHSYEYSIITPSGRWCRATRGRIWAWYGTFVYGRRVMANEQSTSAQHHIVDVSWVHRLS